MATLAQISGENNPFFSKKEFAKTPPYIGERVATSLTTAYSFNDGYSPLDAHYYSFSRG
jgi:hypothetical protein